MAIATPTKVAPEKSDTGVMVVEEEEDWPLVEELAVDAPCSMRVVAVMVKRESV